MDRVQIFEDIAEIITHDYAGAEELVYPGLHVPFLRFCSQMAEQFNFEDENLYNYVQLYLLAVGDPSLVFDIKDYAGFRHFCRGFSVRSDGNELYVTHTRQENQVYPGDRIVTIAYQAPAKFRSLSLLLAQEQPLSERDHWAAILNHARVIEVEHPDGDQEKIILNQFALENFVPEISCRRPDAGTVYLGIQSFAQEEPLLQLLQSNQDYLASCDRLIIDLRHNAGGDRAAVIPLLPYVCDRDILISDFFQDNTIYTRYSARNCDLSIAQLTPFLQSADQPVREMATAITAEFDARRDRGFLLDTQEDGDEVIRSRRSARKIILLTDTNCEDEAEWFVLGCRRMSGVTVIGRSTMGNMDYSHPVTVDYGYGKTFTYPISKTKQCYEGHGFNKTGVPVDIYIPWSKAEIGEDIVMRQALAL